MASLVLLSLISGVVAAPKSHHHLHHNPVRQVEPSSIPSYAIDYGMFDRLQDKCRMNNPVYSTARLASLHRDVLSVRHRLPACSYPAGDQLFCHFWHCWCTYSRQPEFFACELSRITNLSHFQGQCRHEPSLA